MWLRTKKRLPDKIETRYRYLTMFDKIKEKGFQVLALHHAEAILKHDMANAATELEKVLLNIAIPASELVHGGGGEGELTQRLRKSLADDFGWKKHRV